MLARVQQEPSQNIASWGVSDLPLLQHLDHLLYERLTLNNPHKVFLAINLIRVVNSPQQLTLCHCQPVLPQAQH